MSKYNFEVEFIIPASISVDADATAEATELVMEITKALVPRLNAIRHKDLDREDVQVHIRLDQVEDEDPNISPIYDIAFEERRDERAA